MALKKTNLMLSVERQCKQPLERLLPAMINDPELEMKEIADQLGVTKATLGYWLIKLGITTQRVTLLPGETLEITRVS